MDLVQLPDVAELNPKFKSAVSSNAEVGFVPMAAVSEITRRIEREEVRTYKEVAKGFTSFCNGDVIVAKITPCFENGKMALVNSKHQYCFGSTEFHVIRPNHSRLDGRYLYYFLGQEELRREGQSRMTGSAGQRRVPKSFFEQLEIPLPPLPEQRRIAAVLDAADALRAKRRAALGKLDALLQSVFLEMFGDPVRNERGWEVRCLDKVCLSKGTYGSGASAIPYDHNKPRYIRITDINDDGSLLDNRVSPSTDESDWRANALNDGDIVFARSGATVGKTYLYRSADGLSVYAGYLIRFRPNPKIISPEFLFSYTKTKAYRVWVQSRMRVVAQPNINAKQYGQELLLPVPPLPLQERYVDRVRVIQMQRNGMLRQSYDLDRLFVSLQQRAFRGEL